MSVEQRSHRAPQGRDGGSTYYVGRRQFEAPEVYAVTDRDVQRLRSARRYGEPGLDWNGSSAARMELSHVLISRVAGLSPSRELQARFVLGVLGELGDDGFVLETEDIWNWLLLASDEQDFVPAESHRRTWAGRLRTLLPGAGNPSSDG
jgi:hypothetical protein